MKNNQKIPKNFNPASFQLDTTHNINSVASKLPSDITNGMTVLHHFMEIPCSDLIPFQQKGQEDFSCLDDETFHVLMLSISESGVLDPIIVRRCGEKFEILSGEHRWKASVALKLNTIPAHILTDCTEEEAKSVFVMTNLARRKATLKDRVNGWWTVTQLTRYKKQEDIDRLIEDGIIPEQVKTLSRKQQLRYACLHELNEDLFILAESKVLDLHSSGLLAQLSPEQQQDLVSYVDWIKDKKTVELLLSLAKENLEGLSWSEEALEALLFPTQEKSSVLSEAQLFGNAMKQVKKSLKARIPSEQYGDLDSILEEALNLYQEKYPDRLLFPSET